MTYLHKITHFFLASLSVIISCGVAVHDGHFEHALEVRTAHGHFDHKLSSTDLKTMNESRMHHTHSDHNLSNHVLKSFAYQSPSILPNRRHHHKQILAILEEGGRHAFDNANLPILAD